MYPRSGDGGVDRHCTIISLLIIFMLYYELLYNLEYLQGRVSSRYSLYYGFKNHTVFLFVFFKNNSLKNHILL